MARASRRDLTKQAESTLGQPAIGACNLTLVPTEVFYPVSSQAMYLLYENAIYSANKIEQLRLRGRALKEEMRQNGTQKVEETKKELRNEYDEILKLLEEVSACI